MKDMIGTETVLLSVELEAVNGGQGDRQPVTPLATSRAQERDPYRQLSRYGNRPY